MFNKLDISCEPELWEDLPQLEQIKMKLQFRQDPVFFWQNKALGNMTLWPSQIDTLNQFFERDEAGRRKYKELLFAAGMRSGKTAIAALIILTELALCLTMDSPQKHYDLLPKEEIVFLCTASTEEQCIRTIFKKVIAFVETSPFFCSFRNDIKYTSGRLEFPKRLVLLALGSNLKANVGLTVKVFVAEEINFTGEESYKVSPSTLYNRLSKSTTTFKPFGEDIKVAIASRADGNDFLSKRIELARLQKMDTTLILEKTTIEMNPNITAEMLRDEELMDPDSYLNDYGLGIARGGSSYFKKITLDKFKQWKGKNVFSGDPKSGQNKKFTPDLDIDKLVYDPQASQYGLFTDPASVGDAFGLCLAHIRIDNKIVIDGITVFKPTRNEEINSELIGIMIDKIINKVPIEIYVFDIHMYTELKERLVNLGIDAHQHMLRLPDWESLKERVNTNGIEGPYSAYLDKELGDMQLVRSKVNHPSGGSKDMADCLCQTVAYWDNNKDRQQSLSENQILEIQAMR